LGFKLLDQEGGLLGTVFAVVAVEDAGAGVTQPTEGLKQPSRIEGELGARILGFD